MLLVVAWLGVEIVVDVMRMTLVQVQRPWPAAAQQPPCPYPAETTVVGPSASVGTVAELSAAGERRTDRIDAIQTGAGVVDKAVPQHTFTCGASGDLRAGRLDHFGPAGAGVMY